jgi:transcriptional regulator with XRE-family HTH domain
MKLAEIRKKNKISQEQAANALNITLRTYQNYEYGTREPNIDMLLKIADYFNVTTDYLLGRDVPPPPDLEEILKKYDLSALEKKFMIIYCHLDKKHRQALVDALEEAACADKDDAETKDHSEYIPITRSFPLLNNRASAGEGYELDEANAADRKFLLPDEDTDGDFVIQVTGVSMEPDYPDGCYVLIEKYDDEEDLYPCYNDIVLAVCTIHDEDFGYLKQWKEDRLHSLNPDCDDVEYWDSIRFVGKAVAVIERA